MSDPIVEFASRAQLLGATGRRFGQHTLPMCGLTVRYRSLCDGEFTAYEESFLAKSEEGETIRDPKQRPLLCTRLIAACLCDADGNRLLQPGDETALLELDAEDISSLSDTLRVFLGIDQRARRARTEDLAKN